MQPLLKIAGVFERISENTGRLLSWLTLLMVLTTFAIVVLRYAFNIGWIAMQESISYLHALVFMLGAAYAFKHEAHVRVDIFYRNFTPRGKAWVDLLGNLFLLIPVCIFILISSFDYVALAWRIQETSRETGGLPYIYLLKTAIPAMAILLLIQAIAGCLQNIVLLITGQSTLHNSEVEV